MQKGLIRKGLVFSVIVLFIGVSIASGIAVKVDSSKNLHIDTTDNELVEVPIQIYRASSIENHKLQITQEQSDRLDDLIEEFKSDLDKSKNIDETIEIYKDMILSLDEIDILPTGFNIDLFNELVLSRFNKNNCLSNEIEVAKDTEPSNRALFENKNCMVLGRASTTELYPVISFRIFLWTLTSIWLGQIAFGYFYMEGPGGYEYGKATGWISSEGELGSWEYEGSFYGHIDEVFNIPGATSIFIGITGFRGIFLKNSFYFGSASHVKIGTEIP